MLLGPRENPASFAYAHAPLLTNQDRLWCPSFDRSNRNAWRKSFRSVKRIFDERSPRTPRRRTQSASNKQPAPHTSNRWITQESPHLTPGAARVSSSCILPTPATL